MDTGEVLEKAVKFAMLVKSIFNPKMVVLYGSYVKGTAHSESDIDIAVICEEVEGDFLEKAAQLFKLRRDVDVRIEPVLLEESSDDSGFMEDILKTGKIVYARR